MSATAEMTSREKTVIENNEMAGTSDVPSIDDPDKINQDLASNPILADLNKSKTTLEDTLKTAESAENEANENGTKVDPEVDEKTLEATSAEADRLRAMLASQAMSKESANSRITLPLIEDAIKAIMKLLKKLMNFILRRKDEPEYGAGSPGSPGRPARPANPALAEKADETVKKVEDTEEDVNEKVNEIKLAKQRELEESEEMDTPRPGSPGSAGSRPKAQ